MYTPHVDFHAHCLFVTALIKRNFKYHEEDVNFTPETSNNPPLEGSDHFYTTNKMYFNTIY